MEKDYKNLKMGICTKETIMMENFMAWVMLFLYRGLCVG
jgi:hypothetical protein